MLEEQRSRASSSSKYGDGKQYYLELNEEGQPDISLEKIYSVDVNSIVTLHLYSGSPITHKVMLMSNVYQSFPTPWYFDTIKKEDFNISKEKAYIKYPSVINTSIYFVLRILRAGINMFSLVYYNEEEKKYKTTKEFHVIAQPSLMFNNKKIELNSIQLQTVLSKNLGKLSQFETYYKECQLLKYNMIHFTSMQELSEADSLYTIKDQLKLSDSFFEDGDKLTNEAKIVKLKESIELLHDKYQIGSVIDIVLNQTSKDSQWLLDHTECAYNLSNTPWLTVAYEFDKLLVDYSNKFYEKKVGCKSAPYINSESDLNEAMIELEKEINRSNLEEFFLIPIEKYYDEFKIFYGKNKDDAKIFAMKRSYLFNELKENPNISFINNTRGDRMIITEESLYDLIYNSCSNFGESRFGVKMEVEFVGILILEATNDKDKQLNEFDFLRDVKRFINQINDDWSSKAKQMISLGLLNVREFIKYEFIQLKRTGVRRKLIDNYFIAKDPKDKSKIFACNGWIMESDDPNEPFPNLTTYGTWYYFKRKIIIWPDSIKLNYGNNEQDSPFLIQYMTKYIQQMASIYDGFMIDTIISIPLFALQFLMQRAREVNPHLILIGELLDGTSTDEVLYSNKVGINMFMRELIWCTSPEEIAEKVMLYGEGKDLVRNLPDKTFYTIDSNDISFEQTRITTKEYIHLTPKKPLVLLFDLTHDNETYYERFGNISLNLSMMACLTMCDCAVGSTRGFDQLFPFQPSVIKENRLYQFDDSFDDLLKEIRYQASQSEKRKEVFFEFHPRNSVNPFTKTVKLALSSNNWKPDISLTKINDNLFTAKVQLPKGKYQYKYVLDGNLWTYDPSQPMENDIGKNINNVLDLCDETKLIVPDLKLLRHDLNTIRNDFNQKETEIFVHRDKDLISIIRLLKASDLTEASNYDGYALISRPGYDSNKGGISSRVIIPGEISDFISGCYMITPDFEINIVRSEPMLSGIKGNAYYTKDLKFLSSISSISIIQGQTIIDFHSILPNTVILFKLKLNETVKSAVSHLNANLLNLMINGNNLIDYVDICDINQALFKCEKEELDSTFYKRGIFKLDNSSPLVYAGLNHLYCLLSEYKRTQMMDNAIYNNVFKGDWLLDYVLSRLNELKSMQTLNKYLEENVIREYMKLYPHLKPLYFTKLIEVLYYSIVKVALNKISPAIVNYGTFSQTLSLATYEFLGNVYSSTFNYLLGQKQLNINPKELKISVSAGLPHYSIEYYRCFSRETFMSFKGLFLIPQRFSEAKTLIKLYAVTLRHGLIPNQLDSGANPRYNARDSPWLFIQAIKDYISFTNDYSILKEELEMLFLDDNMTQHYQLKSKGEKKIMLLSDIIQVIFQSHATGIDFREWKAGNELDSHLTHDGFNIKISLDPKTGFIYGENQHNAGTWMNKIGMSDRSRNKGIPATSRNGADIEIIALLYSSLDFVIKMIEQGHYKQKSITLKNGVNYPLTQWKLLIKDNFEESFYLSRKTQFNKEGIYKDYLNGDKDKKNEYKLRPNFLIAMVIAPDLFKKHNAVKALENAEKYLLCQSALGIRSLDYEDKDYHSEVLLEETYNYATSHGFNQHNGPEYVWLVGYYLLAKMQFCDSKSDFLHDSSSILMPLMKHIRNSPWMGLPDYTNGQGVLCESSCSTYSVSIAMIYEVISKIASSFQ